MCLAACNRQASYEGRLEFSVDTDLQKLIGWNGAKTHVTDLSDCTTAGHVAADNVGSIADPSNIDALATTRLFTAWFQQSLLDDQVSLRIGQLAADDEFFTSPTAGGLINGTFGWASLASAPTCSAAGRPYPLATPGVRVASQADRADHLARPRCSPAIRPAPIATTLPQACNRYGTTFSFAGGALWMGELQYAVNQDKQADGPAGRLQARRLVRDRRFRRPALRPRRRRQQSCRSPIRAAIGPLNHRGNWGIYGVADQMVWRARQDQPEPVRARRLVAVRPQSDFVLCRRRRRPQRPAARAAPTTCSPSALPTPRSARTRRRSTRTRSRSTDRLIRSATQEVVFEAELRGADRAVVDRAAGPAIHRASGRQRAQSGQSQC